MTFEEFNKFVNAITLGKHLPGAIYLHKVAFKAVNEEFTNYIYKAANLLNIDDDCWNLIKLFKRDFKFTLLHYPDFFTDSYPSLSTSYTIDLIKGNVRKASYVDSNNPPILHRKETFLLSDHPKVEEFKLITKEGENIGLYEKTRNIGFKKNWEKLIRKKGYILKNGHLQELEICKDVGNEQKVEITTDIVIERHKTALSRDNLSVPMQLLARKGFLDGVHSVFDYGCGKGDDLRELQAHGINAYGWDPVYKRDGNITDCDIVNLGYVINVIEDKKERQEALENAFRLANKILVVSAMIGNENIINKFTSYKDGVITQKNTFQKYYSQGELKNYIEQTLHTNVIATSPGIFFVFKDEIEEQKYLLERQKSRYAWRQYTTKPTSPIKNKLAKSIIDKHEQLFADFWETLLGLGRTPGNDEFEYATQIRKVAGSIPKAIDVVTKYYGEEYYEEAREIRRSDLLVYFALGFFSKRQAYSRMPESLQRDIKAYFGKYTDAREQGKTLLYSMAEPEVIYKACLEAQKKLPASELNGQHDLIFHRQYLNLCPKELRVYIGCAIQLYGDIDEVDLIKAHIGSGKVSFMIYDDWTKDIPLLKERIKIKLREQDIDFFDYVDDYEPQPLNSKSIYSIEGSSISINSKF